MQEADIAPIRPWLTETTNLLRAGQDAARRCFGDWAPAPGSHAEWELAQADSVGWGDAVALVQVVLLDWTEAATAHFGALAAVIDAGEVTHSVPTLVRAVVEHTHKIAWLLEPTHGTSPGAPLTLAERAARAHLEELYSLRHRRNTVKKLVGRNAEAFTECDRLYRDFRDVTIPALFGRVRGETSGLEQADETLWRLAGQQWRGPTALAERYGRRQSGDKALDGTYDALCAYSHPTLYAQREFVEHIPSDGGTIRRRSISTDFLTRVVGGAATAFWRAALDVVSYFGWDRSPLDQWARQLNSWRPGLVEELASEAGEVVREGAAGGH
jgi:hypothetical protein